MSSFRGNGNFNYFPYVVPDRWLNCPRKGKLILSKFLPFKTPLDNNYDNELSSQDRFPPEFISDISKSVTPTLGLVIDLTKSNRYYASKSIVNKNIEYQKLRCEGHNAPPTEDQVQEFISICSRYWSRNPNLSIGVHCTHGFNRTGFLIVSYLVIEDGCDLESAVREFSQARHPGIYKQDYIDILYSRLGEDDQKAIVAPARPGWCDTPSLSSISYNNVIKYPSNTSFPIPIPAPTTNTPTTSTNSTITTTSPPPPPPPLPTTTSTSAHDIFIGQVNEDTQIHVMEEILNKKSLDMRLPENRIVNKEILETCKQYCNYNIIKFPGSQPVTLDYNRIKYLSQHPYRISWKADGTRYMVLIIDIGRVYLIRRDNAVFHFPSIKFPSYSSPTGHVRNCLIDAELVLDERIGGVIRPLLLIYDIVAYEGNIDVSRKFHKERMSIILELLINTREKAAEEGTLDKHLEPFSIQSKCFWDIHQWDTLCENYIKKLGHKTDGYIFNREDEGYIPGTCEHLLKWKPPELNSIDFRFKLHTPPAQEGMLVTREGQLLVIDDSSGRGNEIKFDKIVDFNSIKKEGYSLPDIDGRIIEFTVDKNNWKILRVRNDKARPNSFSVAVNIFSSISYPISYTDLSTFIKAECLNLKNDSRANKNSLDLDNMKNKRNQDNYNYRPKQDNMKNNRNQDNYNYQPKHQKLGQKKQLKKQPPL